MSDPIIQTLIGVLFGGGIVYGTVKTEIRLIKEQIAENKTNGERIARIEAKIDLLTSNFLTNNHN